MENLVKTFTRDLSIVVTQWWTVAQGDNFKKELGVAYTDNPAYSNGLSISYLYLESDLEKIKQAFLNKLKSNPRYYLEIRLPFRAHVAKTRELLKRLEEKGELALKDLSVLKQHFVDLYPAYRFTLLVPSSWADDVKATLGEESSETIEYTLEDRLYAEGTAEAIDALLRKLVGGKLKALGKPPVLAKFLLEGELRSLLNGKQPEWDEVKSRTGGFTYCEAKIIATRDYRRIFQQHGYRYVEEKAEENTLKGTVAYSGGLIKAKAQLLLAVEQVGEFKEGNVLVTPMTVPDFLPAMKRASAIVTDEGGVTCHAAIVSRELKIPCVIGTKVVTKLLKTGDTVEVNTETGLVSKIS